MKRNFKNFLTAMLFVAALPMAAPLARAQGMPMMMPMGHHAERLAEHLKLTPEQKAQWDALVRHEARNLANVASKVAPLMLVKFVTAIRKASSDSQRNG